MTTVTPAVTIEANFVEPNYAYFAGQDVPIEVRISTPENTESNKPFTVNWLCVQVCQSEIISSNPKVKDWADKIGYQSRSRPVTKPNVVAVNVDLQPGTSRSWKTEETIPLTEVLPSFNGQYLKVKHFVHVAVQINEYPTQTVNLPLRVIYLAGLQRLLLDGGDLGPVNPFVQESKRARNLRLFEMAVDLLESYVFGRNEHVFNVADGDHVIAKLSMTRTSFKVGDQITATLVFDRTLPRCCMQVLAILQSEESLSQPSDLPAEVEGQPANNPPLHAKIVSYSRQHEFTASYADCALNLDIPVKAAQGFSSEFVNLTWRLHFEFVLASAPFQSLCPSKQRLDGSVLLSTPHDVNDVRTLQWNLPLRIFPLNPARVPPELNTGVKGMVGL